MGRRHVVGLSLFEVVVVVAIIAVLAGLLLPAVSEARRRGLVAYDVNQLRQMGTAWELYRNDHDGQAPLLSPLMVKAGYGSQGVAEAKLDPFPRGRLGAFLDHLRESDVPEKTQVPQGKFSFLTTADVFAAQRDGNAWRPDIPSLQELLRDGRDPGYMVHCVGGPCLEVPGQGVIAPGVWLRMAEGHSVRRVVIEEVPLDGSSRCMSDIDLFVTLDEFLRRQICGSR